MYGLRGPCKDCKFRTVGCHGNCAEYAKFKALHEARAKVVREKKLNDVLLTNHHRRWY